MARRIFILGAGRFGTHLGTRLSEFGCEVALGDKDADRVARLAQKGFHAVEIDAEDVTALQEAGVQDADAVVVSIGENMQGNILTTLLLKELQIKKLICRALDDKHATVLEKLGADLVLLPDRDMAYRLAERLRDNVGGDRQRLCGDYQLAQIQLGPALEGKTLAEAGLQERYHVTLVLLTRGETKGEAKPFEPAPGLKLAARDVLFLVGRRDHINKFERECGLAQ